MIYAAAILTALVLQAVMVVVARRIDLVKPNFKEKPILGSYGFTAFPPIALLVYGLLTVGRADKKDASLYLSVMGAMWLLGSIDDLFGSRDVGGFKGHFRKLLVERKLTTGALKALGGGVVGVVAGWVVSGGDPARWIAAALVIPLAANVLNLVDLRPGRAMAVFFLGLGVTCILTLGRMPAPWIVGTVATLALAWAIVDSRGLAMMGDAGSNMLGAALGLTIALSTVLPAQIAAILVFLCVHYYSEKHSISALVEGNRVLRAIDRSLGVR